MPITGNHHRGPGLAGSPLLLAALVLPSALAASELEVVPAWGGRFVPGEPTEVRVDFASPIGGPVLIRIEGGASAVEKSLSAEAGRRVVVSLPAYPGSDGQLAVGVLLPNGEQVVQALALQSRREKLAAVVIATGARPDAAPEGTIGIGIGDLPSIPAGYRALASLTMEPDVLAPLDADQTTALAHFLAACGVLIVPDADPALLDGLRSTAGCAGRFVGTTRGIDTPPALPGHDRLAATLSGDAGTDARQLALLLLPYPLLLAGLAMLRRTGPWLLLLPPAAALAYAAALPQTAPPAIATTWAETSTGDTHHRFVTLLRSGGGDATPLRLPPEAGLVVPAGGAHRLQIDAGGELVLPAPRALLTYREYRLEGVGRVPFRLRTTPSGNGIRVDNAGPEPSPPGWLLWRGEGYPIPALTPGGSQTVDDDAARGDPPLALPARTGTAPSLLVALPQPPLAGADSQIRSTGWLLVRPVDELAS